jgi:hypothetical protein
VCGVSRECGLVVGVSSVARMTTAKACGICVRVLSSLINDPSV